MWERREMEIVSLRKPKFRCKWKSNINVRFKELACEDVGFILLDQGILRIW